MCNVSIKYTEFLEVNMLCLFYLLWKTQTTHNYLPYMYVVYIMTHYVLYIEWLRGTQKLRNSETQKLRNSETLKLRNSETLKLRNSEIQKSRNSETHKLRNSETLKL